MPGRSVYLVRHGEAGGDGELTATGRRQAEALADRLADVRFTAVHHGPLPRAAQTARLVAARLPGVPLLVDEAAGDYLPPVPDPAELPAPFARLVESYTPAERAQGAALADTAVRRFAEVPESMTGDENVLVVTHSFLVAWFVRHALGAPERGWLGVNAANAGLTVVRCLPGRGCRLLTFNDLAHLPAELRWTGFPAELRA